MKTNQIISHKVKKWLNQENMSYQMLAEKLGISKSLVGHMLNDERTILPERVKMLADLMGLSVKELVRDESFQTEQLKVQLRGAISNRRSKRELEALLFSIEDYIALKKQVK